MNSVAQNKCELAADKVLKNKILRPSEACQEIIDSSVSAGPRLTPSPLSETPGDLIDRIRYERRAAFLKPNKSKPKRSSFRSLKVHVGHIDADFSRKLHERGHQEHERQGEHHRHDLAVTDPHKRGEKGANQQRRGK
jgi:hypothetical protein